MKKTCANCATKCSMRQFAFISVIYCPEWQSKGGGEKIDSSPIKSIKFQGPKEELND